MAGINVPQYDIYKIGTKQLKYYNWDLQITKRNAFLTNKIVSLFEAQEFRLIADILNTDISQIEFDRYLLIVVVDSPGDFKKVLRKDGIKVNGVTFKRFVGTSSGLKNNTMIFANVDILEELNRRCECGRKMDIKIVPAKLEAYKALTCSASQPISDPHGIIVVSDCLTHIKEDVIMIDDTDEAEEPTMKVLKDEELENDASDGFCLCTIDYMRRVSEDLGLDYITSGVCLRNAWLKGMMYPFPIKEFAEQYNNGNYEITDIWGQTKDLRDAELILTESVFKLWYAYDSAEDYIQKYHENKYGFAVTKISPHVLEDEREVNYQYLQSYDFSDEDIEELCAPTVKFLKNSMCGDYAQTIKFLGLNGSIENNTWQHALRVSPKMMGDPFIIDSVHRMIRKKIDGAKIGKLSVTGNYQIISGDPFSLMQHICGLEVTGLLKANEIYSKYWSDKNVSEVLLFRSPMTVHNNIRRSKVVNNEQTAYWYQYMNTVLIINSFDTTCQSLNGADYDGDLVMSTNNPVLLRRHKVLPAIICIQRNVDKIIPVEEDIIKTNRDGMGNKVGTITNRVTAMMEVQSHFEPDSKEYKELDYRIACGQLFQQDQIDKLKGIIAKPMPKYWYNLAACKGDKFLKSICVAKKPYFMTYIYDDYKKDHRQYLKKAEISALDQNHKDIDEIDLSEKFMEYYNSKFPFGMGRCAMNRICWYIEYIFKGLQKETKAKYKFNYKFLKAGVKQSEERIKTLKSLCFEYVGMLRQIKEHGYALGTLKNVSINERHQLRRFFMHEAEIACPDEDERADIILDLCYKHGYNKQFMWDCVGKTIIQRLEKMTYGDF